MEGCTLFLYVLLLARIRYCRPADGTSQRTTDDEEVQQLAHSAVTAMMPIVTTSIAIHTH